MYRNRCAALLALLLAVGYGFALEPETGIASWYGPGFHGRRTASGEIFDKEALTAAHRSLPFGTLVRVRNLDNGRDVVVRINDRGPFARDRILDLSEAAARVLGIIEAGTARVRLEILETGKGEMLAQGPGTAEKGAAPLGVRIQVASFKDAGNAARALERLRLSGFSPILEAAGGYTRVILIDVPPDDADAIVRRLAGLGYPGALVRVETRY